MKFTVATVALAIICLNIDMSACDNMHDHMKEVSDNCKAKRGTTDEAIAKIRAQNGVADDKNAMCHLDCMMEEVGALQDGKFNEENFLKLVSDHLSEDEAKQAYESCKDETGEAECETAYKLANCLCKRDESKCKFV